MGQRQAPLTGPAAIIELIEPRRLKAQPVLICQSALTLKQLINRGGTALRA